MVYSLTYHRPSASSEANGSVSADEKQRYIRSSSESDSQCSVGIPEALSFDRVVNGGTCPPCTLRDFMNYMRYIQRDPENLQFYLWYRSYAQRFENLPGSERALAPEWSIARTEADTKQRNPVTYDVDSAIASAFEGTDFESTKEPSTEKEAVSPYLGGSPRKDSSTNSNSNGHSPHETHFDEKVSMDTSDYHSPQSLGRTNDKYNATANNALANAGLQWSPFTAQPFRQEVARIISIYLAPGSPRQLALSASERSAVLHALQNTTHPSAFHAAVVNVEYSLRTHDHPRFIRWTICNGNRPRVIFARGLGIVTILLALVASLLITLSSAGRGYRVIPLIGYVIGISTLFAAYKGMCVVLHGMHHRHIRPWEMFASGEDDASVETRGYSEESLLSINSNSFETEPWVARYEKRNFVRKIFDREVWIQEPALRQIQDTIFVQSLLGALVVGGIITGIFCAVPHGDFY